MTIASVGVICSVVFGALGFAVAYLSFRVQRRKAEEEHGKTSGAIASDIGYIKAGVDDLKRENHEARRDIENMRERIVSCEESCKSAHKRIDRMEKMERGKND